ncbi:flagellar biosynthesis protein FlgD [Belnapia sp. T18]|uniref:Basal-body rod modification protein FlgD n=1 Tax=Belnapia arida TaxID=2804533 RepID=A0ABS1TVZ7_9PROT|nr:flagellar hook capping FlgD N-terminal domain-containing protein [Belnapia arida]MBL6076621.1 flagellar biosynthesis protein FlgD [Belnapia arida]
MSGTIQGTTGAGGSAAAAGGKAKTGLAGDFNTFLTLLTTQLQNQDPTKAMDTNEMTNQLVSFAGVEQQIAMNANLTRLIGLQQGAQLTAAAPLIGERVEVESDRLSLQDGSATLRLPTAGPVQQAVIRVLDSAGRILREDTVKLGSAAQDWRWDGRTKAGQRLPDGAYGFAVAGLDAQGAAQTVAATVVGTATAARRPSGGDVQLQLGAVSVGFDAMRGIANP